MSTISIEKTTFKLPDIATPIGYNNTIYFLNPCPFDQKRKVFSPQGPAFTVTFDGKVRELPPPKFFRSKCGLIRKGECVYIIGGEAT